MKTTLIVLATLIIAVACGQTKQVSTETNAKAEQEILALEDEYVGLAQKNDFKRLAEALDKGLTDQCNSVNGDGRVDNKPSMLKAIRAMADQKDPNQLNETYQFVERQVDVYGDAAVLSAKGIWRSQGGAKAGKQPAESRFTHFFVKQDGQWKIAKIHITDLAAR